MTSVFSCLTDQARLSAVSSLIAVTKDPSSFAELHVSVSGLSLLHLALLFLFADGSFAGVSLSAAGWASLLRAFPRGWIDVPFHNPSFLCELPLRLRGKDDVEEYLRHSLPLGHLLVRDTLPVPPRM